MSDMTKQWFSVAFHGLTKEKRDELIDMECAQVMGHSNVFDERDALKARVAELEAQLAVAPVVAQGPELVPVNEIGYPLLDTAAVEAATMALLGKDKDPAPDVNWMASRNGAVSQWKERVYWAITAYLAAAPVAEQEPVAWRFCAYDGGRWVYREQPQSEPTWQPLYAAPVAAQGERQPEAVAELVVADGLGQIKIVAFEIPSGTYPMYLGPRKN